MRDGLGPARVRLHGGPVLAELTARFGAPGPREGVWPGRSSTPTARWSTRPPCCPTGASVYLYRELPDEVPVPFDIPVLYHDADIVVVDKPHFLATMPRGRHVAQTALVRLRRELGLPELSPAHRLDRLTAGVLLFTTRRELRGAYQTLFARGLVRKTYLARAAVDPALALPRVVRSRIIKRRGHLQAVCEPGVPNAETLVELVVAGRPVPADPAHRAHPPAAGAHGVAGDADHGDPLYPNVIDVPADDFSTPLRLLAQRIEFDDPLTGLRREFVSRRPGP